MSKDSHGSSIQCPTHVDVFVNGPKDELYIFYDEYIYQLNQNQVVKKHDIDIIFPQVKEPIIAGYYNEKTHTFVLFDRKNRVFWNFLGKCFSGVRLSLSSGWYDCLR